MCNGSHKLREPALLTTYDKCHGDTKCHTIMTIGWHITCERYRSWLFKAKYSTLLPMEAATARREQFQHNNYNSICEAPTTET